VVLLGATNGVSLNAPVLVDVDDLLTFTIPSSAYVATTVTTSYPFVTTVTSLKINTPGGTVLIKSNNYRNVAVYTTNSVVYTNTTYNYSKFGGADFTVQFYELNWDGSLKCIGDNEKIINVGLEDVISVTP
jgi:hypothetical protein